MLGPLVQSQRGAFIDLFFCNRNKGPDVGSYLFSSQSFVRFFNPRTDRWADHF